jgi:hypothetical protein
MWGTFGFRFMQAGVMTLPFLGTLDFWFWDVLCASELTHKTVTPIRICGGIILQCCTWLTLNCCENINHICINI